eukprot:TRINITY_DN3249_c0_g2_i1.p1 TRINITY_DN3249_c0_g2~~TRINITY_DN3249_c0_g2_i1.p1  ORF type:complete len:140 (+),score=35.22 TRINITY_DN3249_c0_g2_i1:446-865(+)
MNKEGWKDITLCDFSDVVIEQMNREQGDDKPLKFVVMDVYDLKFPPNSFDVVIDKGFTDSIHCGHDFLINLEKTNRNLKRVLRSKGKWIIFSYSGPQILTSYFKKKEWKIEVKKLENIYLYTLEVLKQPVRQPSWLRNE